VKLPIQELGQGVNVLKWQDWSHKTDPHAAERFVLAFDLDDTLTHGGALPSQVVSKLEEAQNNGLKVILVTGRSGGWVDALIKLMPFDGIVGENGAIVSYWPQGKIARSPRQEPQKLYWQREQLYGAEYPVSNQEQLTVMSDKILEQIPKARVASDQLYRLYDLAIDFAEEVSPPLTLQEAQTIKIIFESMGATAKVSSIHVNGWRGEFNKKMGLQRLLKQWNESWSLDKNVIYVGDSPNDGPLFASGALGVGVANLLQFTKAGLTFEEPKFLTLKDSAKGAIEVIDSVLRSRDKLKSNA
jgi:HAD superfamily hydrolase (TIGR01484 family)